MYIQQLRIHLNNLEEEKKDKEEIIKMNSVLLEKNNVMIYRNSRIFNYLMSYGE